MEIKIKNRIRKILRIFSGICFIGSAFLNRFLFFFAIIFLLLTIPFLKTLEEKENCKIFK